MGTFGFTNNKDLNVLDYGYGVYILSFVKYGGDQDVGSNGYWYGLDRDKSTHPTMILSYFLLSPI